MPTHRLQLETEPAHMDVRLLLEGLYHYNVEQTGRDDGQWLAIFLRDETDRIMAGLHGWTWGGWMKVSFLWVSPQERRQGRGRHLLLMAEAEARKRGCSKAVAITAGNYGRRIRGFHQPASYARLSWIAFVRDADDKAVMAASGILRKVSAKQQLRQLTWGTTECRAGRRSASEGHNELL
jgi:GNAT superfamily N-acetyltransferase